MLTKPFIHLNGRRGAKLAEAYQAARKAIKAAYAALKKTAPKGRDYDPLGLGPTALTAATNEHASRLKRLDEITEELDELIIHCDEWPAL